MTKSEILKALKALGYIIHYDTSRNGDCAEGSRLYFAKISSVKNEFGCYQNGVAIANRDRGGWSFWER